MAGQGPGPVFWLLATVMLAGALGVVTLRNMVHAALCLALTLLMAGGLYLNLGADLLAGFQVLIYVGAVVTLTLVAIMLIAKIADKDLVQTEARGGWAAIVSAGVGLLLCYVLASASWTPNAALVEAGVDHERQAKALSLALLDPYLLPFEVASLLLLVALMGAVVLAQHTALAERREVKAALREPAAPTEGDQPDA